MVNSTLRAFHLDYVSQHLNQTYLVSALLEKNLISIENIYGLTEETEVFQWLAFNNFDQRDYDDLIAANIPVIHCELGLWVGITSFGSHYDLAVYPEIISALYHVHCTYSDIQNLKQKASA